MRAPAPGMKALLKSRSPVSEVTSVYEGATPFHPPPLPTDWNLRLEGFLKSAWGHGQLESLPSASSAAPSHLGHNVCFSCSLKPGAVALAFIRGQVVETLHEVEQGVGL